MTHPEAYLDPSVRAGISVFARLDGTAVERAVTRLHEDLSTGAWHERTSGIVGSSELHLGYRLLIAEY
ncbi:MAG: hypothetical protein WBC33_09780 [Conexibacter sp.]